MARALEGITVVDFSHVVAGPLATHFLALNGARVIKVEPPQGDPLRNYTSSPEELGMAPAFRGINLGKQSVVLDLKSDAGRAAAWELLGSADIVVENFRPGVMDRLGFGYDAVRAANPSVIYCSVSGFGQTGAMSNLPAIDQIVQSLSGLMLLSGRDDDPAQRVGFPIVDTFTGLLAAFAIQTAVVQRERGKAIGQHIDVAMLDATLVMMMSVVNPLLMTGQSHQRTGNRGFSRAPTADTFACRSGEITIGAVEDAAVATLLGALDLSHLLDDPAFASRLARIENAEAMRAHLCAAFACADAAEWEARLTALGLPAARVLSVEQAIALPHLADRDLFQTVAGERCLNAGYQFATAGPYAQSPAPQLARETIQKSAGH